MAEPLVQINSSPSPDPDQIAGRSFSLVRRGFDPDAVRKYLEEIAALLREARTRENSLRTLLEDAQRQAETPNLDSATLSAAVGAETGRVLQAAHEAAREVIDKAEAKAASALADAESAANQRIQSAQREATSSLNRARVEADAAIEAGKRTCLEMVEEAREARRRILGDLAERRRSLHSQLEQLRAGKNTLANVVDAVSSSVVAIRDRLVGAEEEARDAADVASRSSSFDDGVSLDELVAHALSILPPADEPSEALDLSETPRIESSNPLFDGRALEDEADELEGHELDDANASLVPIVDDQLDGEDVSIMDVAVEVDVAEELSEVVSTPVDESDDSANPVDELFAKIRASREEDLDRARSVLSEDAEQPPSMSDDAVVDSAGLPVEVQVEVPVEASESDDVETTTSATNVEDALDESDELDSTSGSSRTSPNGAAVIETESETEVDLADSDDGTESAPESESNPTFALRDELLQVEMQPLSRSLKRALGSEQNELLDAIRQLAKNADVAALFDEEESVERLALACASGLADSFRAGVRFGEQLCDQDPKASNHAGKSGVIEKEAAIAGDEISRQLAGEIVASVNRRVAAGLAEGESDQSALGTLIGVAYREWKGTRVELLVGDFATRAFALGTRAMASKRGLKVSWILDSSGAQCGDCDDNALAGSQTSGDPFPTGQTDPPAHPGCRCLLVPIVS